MAGINDFVSTTEGLKTLSEALIVSGIDEVLSEEGPFTFFAPNVDAFSQIDTDTLVALAANRDDLACILLSHVVRGRHTLVDLSDSSLLENLGGTDLWIGLSEEGAFYVEDARIVRGDIEVDNGVIHIIDVVLLPLNEDVSRNAEDELGTGFAFGAVSDTDSDAIPFVDYEPYGERREGSGSIAV